MDGRDAQTAWNRAPAFPSDCGHVRGNGLRLYRVRLFEPSAPSFVTVYRDYLFDEQGLSTFSLTREDGLDGLDIDMVDAVHCGRMRFGSCSFTYTNTWSFPYWVTLRDAEIDMVMSDGRMFARYSVGHLEIDGMTVNGAWGNDGVVVLGGTGARTTCWTDMFLGIDRRGAFDSLIDDIVADG